MKKHLDLARVADGFLCHSGKYLIVYGELSVRPSTLSHVFPFCLAIVAVNTHTHRTHPLSILNSQFSILNSQFSYTR